MPSEPTSQSESSRPPEPQAPARSSRVTDAAFPVFPPGLRPSAHTRIPPIAMTRMQAWESMERAKHKVDRLRAHYEAALAKDDPALADTLAGDLFNADEKLRQAERKLATFAPSPNRRIAFSADPTVNTGCWVILWLSILSNLPFLLGVIIFLLVLVVIALLALIGIL